jgi:ribosomal protein S18 acetylase RimI-like enzyme
MIRVARPDDRADLYEICLRTGDGGADAALLHDDPVLLGHVYLGAYLELEPELAFVVTGDAAGAGPPQGYCVGTADTARFERECEARWWPQLRARYPVQAPRSPADQRLVEMIHEPRATAPALLDGFPAHLHIDLLPALQGRGLGAELIEHMVRALEVQGCPGLHVGVARGNVGAIRFYGRVGFEEVAGDDDSVVLGRSLAGLTTPSPDPGTGRPATG